MPPLGSRGAGASQEGVKYSLNETVEESFFGAFFGEVSWRPRLKIYHKICPRNWSNQKKHPGRLIWNLQITYLEKENDLIQTSMISTLIFRKKVETYPLTIMASKKSWHICRTKMEEGWQQKSLNYCILDWSIPITDPWEERYIYLHDHGSVNLQ